MTTRSKQRRRLRQPGLSTAAIGIAIAVLATSSPTASPGRPGYELALHLPDWGALVVVVAGLAVFLAIVSALVPAPVPDDEEAVREIAQPPPMSPWTVALLLAIQVFAIVLAMLLWQHLLLRPTSLPHDVVHSSPAPLPRGPVSAPLPHQTLRVAGPQIALTLVVASCAAMILAGAGIAIAANRPWDQLAAWFRRRRRRTVVTALATAMARSATELEAESTDPRQAVIAC